MVRTDREMGRPVIKMRMNTYKRERSKAGEGDKRERREGRSKVKMMRQTKW